MTNSTYDHEVADQIAVEHEDIYNAGRQCAREDIAHEGVTPVPVNDARTYLARMLDAGRDCKAAFWLGYADEMAGQDTSVLGASVALAILRGDLVEDETGTLRPTNVVPSTDSPLTGHRCQVVGQASNTPLTST